MKVNIFSDEKKKTVTLGFDGNTVNLFRKQYVLLL